MLIFPRRCTSAVAPLQVRCLSVPKFLRTFAAYLPNSLYMAKLILNWDMVVTLCRFIIQILPDIIAIVDDLKDDGLLNGSNQHEENE